MLNPDEIVKGAKIGAQHEGISAQTYHTGYPLSDHEIEFATLYEIARSRGISISEAAKKCYFNTISFPSEADYYSQLIRDSFKEATAEKPTFILLNYFITSGEEVGMHWAVVAISKDKSGNAVITHMNSALRNAHIRPPEIENFIDITIPEEIVKSGGKVIAKIDESQANQYDNCCGLSCARACASFLTPGISQVMGYEGDLECSYAAQARRTFSMLQYTSLDLAKRVPEMEMEALAQSGILSENEKVLVKKDSQLLDTTKLLVAKETFRALKVFCDTTYKSRDHPKTPQRVQELLERYNKPDGFDIKSARQELFIESLYGQYHNKLPEYNQEEFQKFLQNKKFNLDEAQRELVQLLGDKRLAEQMQQQDSALPKPLPVKLATPTTLQPVKPPPPVPPKPELTKAEPAKAETDKAAQEKAAALKAEAEKAAVLKAEADRVVALKAETDRIAAEKAQKAAAKPVTLEQFDPPLPPPPFGFALDKVGKSAVKPETAVSVHLQQGESSVEAPQVQKMEDVRTTQRAERSPQFPVDKEKAPPAQTMQDKAPPPPPPDKDVPARKASLALNVVSIRNFLSTPPYSEIQNDDSKLDYCKKILESGLRRIANAGNEEQAKEINEAMKLVYLEALRLGDEMSKDVDKELNLKATNLKLDNTLWKKEMVEGWYVSDIGKVGKYIAELATQHYNPQLQAKPTSPEPASTQLEKPAVRRVAPPPPPLTKVQELRAAAQRARNAFYDAKRELGLAIEDIPPEVRETISEQHYDVIAQYADIAYKAQLKLGNEIGKSSDEYKLALLYRERREHYKKLYEVEKRNTPTEIKAAEKSIRDLGVKIKELEIKDPEISLLVAPEQGLSKDESRALELKTALLNQVHRLSEEEDRRAEMEEALVIKKQSDVEIHNEDDEELVRKPLEYEEPKPLVAKEGEEVAVASRVRWNVANPNPDKEPHAKRRGSIRKKPREPEPQKSSAVQSPPPPPPLAELPARKKKKGRKPFPKSQEESESEKLGTAPPPRERHQVYFGEGLGIPQFPSLLEQEAAGKQPPVYTEGSGMMPPPKDELPSTHVISDVPSSPQTLPATSPKPKESTVETSSDLLSGFNAVLDRLLFSKLILDVAKDKFYLKGAANCLFYGCNFLLSQCSETDKLQEQGYEDLINRIKTLIEKVGIKSNTDLAGAIKDLNDLIQVIRGPDQPNLIQSMQNAIGTKAAEASSSRQYIIHKIFNLEDRYTIQAQRPKPTIIQPPVYKPDSDKLPPLAQEDESPPTEVMSEPSLTPPEKKPTPTTISQRVFGGLTRMASTITSSVRSTSSPTPSPRQSEGEKAPPPPPPVFRARSSEQALETLMSESGTSIKRRKERKLALATELSSLVSNGSVKEVEEFFDRLKDSKSLSLEEKYEMCNTAVEQARAMLEPTDKGSEAQNRIEEVISTISTEGYIYCKDLFTLKAGELAQAKGLDEAKRIIIDMTKYYGAAVKFANSFALEEAAVRRGLNAVISGLDKTRLTATLGVEKTRSTISQVDYLQLWKLQTSTTPASIQAQSVDNVEKLLSVDDVKRVASEYVQNGNQDISVIIAGKDYAKLKNSDKYEICKAALLSGLEAIPTAKKPIKDPTAINDAMKIVYVEILKVIHGSKCDLISKGKAPFDEYSQRTALDDVLNKKATTPEWKTGSVQLADLKWNLDNNEAYIKSRDAAEAAAHETWQAELDQRREFALKKLEELKDNAISISAESERMRDAYQEAYITSKEWLVNRVRRIGETDYTDKVTKLAELNESMKKVYLETLEFARKAYGLRDYDKVINELNADIEKSCVGADRNIGILDEWKPNSHHLIDAKFTDLFASLSDASMREQVIDKIKSEFRSHIREDKINTDVLISMITRKASQLPYFEKSGLDAESLRAIVDEMRAKPVAEEKPVEVQRRRSKEQAPPPAVILPVAKASPPPTQIMQDLPEPKPVQPTPEEVAAAAAIKEKEKSEIDEIAKSLEVPNSFETERYSKLQGLAQYRVCEKALLVRSTAIVEYIDPERALVMRHEMEIIHAEIKTVMQRLRDDQFRTGTTIIPEDEYITNVIAAIAKADAALAKYKAQAEQEFTKPLRDKNGVIQALVTTLRTSENIDSSFFTQGEYPGLADIAKYEVCQSALLLRSEEDYQVREVIYKEMLPVMARLRGEQLQKGITIFSEEEYNGVKLDRLSNSLDIHAAEIQDLSGRLIGWLTGQQQEPKDLFKTGPYTSLADIAKFQICRNALDSIAKPVTQKETREKLAIIYAEIVPVIYRMRDEQTHKAIPYMLDAQRGIIDDALNNMFMLKGLAYDFTKEPPYVDLNDAGKYEMYKAAMAIRLKSIAADHDFASVLVKRRDLALVFEEIFYLLLTSHDIIDDVEINKVITEALVNHIIIGSIDPKQAHSVSTDDFLKKPPYLNLNNIDKNKICTMVLAKSAEAIAQADPSSAGKIRERMDVVYLETFKVKSDEEKRRKAGAYKSDELKITISEAINNRLLIPSEVSSYLLHDVYLELGNYDKFEVCLKALQLGLEAIANETRPQAARVISNNMQLIYAEAVKALSANYKELSDKGKSVPSPDQQIEMIDQIIMRKVNEVMPDVSAKKKQVIPEDKNLIIAILQVWHDSNSRARALVTGAAELERAKAAPLPPAMFRYKSPVIQLRERDSEVRQAQPLVEPQQEVVPEERLVDAPEPEQQEEVTKHRDVQLQRQLTGLLEQGVAIKPPGALPPKRLARSGMQVPDGMSSKADFEAYFQKMDMTTDASKYDFAKSILAMQEAALRNPVTAENRDQIYEAMKFVSGEAYGWCMKLLKDEIDNLAQAKTQAEADIIHAKMQDYYKDALKYASNFPTQSPELLVKMPIADKLVEVRPKVENNAGWFNKNKIVKLRNDMLNKWDPNHKLNEFPTLEADWMKEKTIEETIEALGRFLIGEHPDDTPAMKWLRMDEFKRLPQAILNDLLNSPSEQNIDKVYNTLNNYIIKGKTDEFIKLFNLCSPEIQRQLLENRDRVEPKNLLYNSMMWGNQGIYVRVKDACIRYNIEVLDLIFDSARDAARGRDLYIEGQKLPKAEVTLALPFFQNEIFELMQSSTVDEIDNKRLLNIAVYFGSAKAVQVALRNGADVTLKGSRDRSPIATASMLHDFRHDIFMHIIQHCFTEIENGQEVEKYKQAIAESGAENYVYSDYSLSEFENYLKSAVAYGIKFELSPIFYIAPFEYFAKKNEGSAQDALVKFKLAIDDGLINPIIMLRNNKIFYKDNEPFERECRKFNLEEAIIRCGKIPEFNEALDYAFMHGLKNEIERGADPERMRPFYDELLTIRGEEGKFKLQAEILNLIPDIDIEKEKSIRAQLFGESEVQLQAAEAIFGMFNNLRKQAKRDEELDFTDLDAYCLRLRSSGQVGNQWLNQLVAYNAAFLGDKLEQINWTPEAIGTYFAGKERENQAEWDAAIEAVAERPEEAQMRLDISITPPENTTHVIAQLKDGAEAGDLSAVQAVLKGEEYRQLSDADKKAVCKAVLLAGISILRTENDIVKLHAVNDTLKALYAEFVRLDFKDKGYSQLDMQEIVELDKELEDHVHQVDFKSLARTKERELNFWNHNAIDKNDLKSEVRTKTASREFFEDYFQGDEFQQASAEKRYEGCKKILARLEKAIKERPEDAERIVGAMKVVYEQAIECCKLLVLKGMHDLASVKNATKAAKINDKMLGYYKEALEFDKQIPRELGVAGFAQKDPLADAIEEERERAQANVDKGFRHKKLRSAMLKKWNTEELEELKLKWEKAQLSEATPPATKLFQGIFTSKDVKASLPNLKTVLDNQIEWAAILHKFDPAYSLGYEALKVERPYAYDKMKEFMDAITDNVKELTKLYKNLEEKPTQENRELLKVALEKNAYLIVGVVDLRDAIRTRDFSDLEKDKSVSNSQTYAVGTHKDAAQAAIEALKARLELEKVPPEVVRAEIIEEPGDDIILRPVTMVLPVVVIEPLALYQLRDRAVALIRDGSREEIAAFFQWEDYKKLDNVHKYNLCQTMLAAGLEAIESADLAVTQRINASMKVVYAKALESTKGLLTDQVGYLVEAKDEALMQSVNTSMEKHYKEALEYARQASETPDVYKNAADALDSAIEQSRVVALGNVRSGMRRLDMRAKTKEIVRLRTEMLTGWEPSKLQAKRAEFERPYMEAEAAEAAAQKGGDAIITLGKLIATPLPKPETYSEAEWSDAVKEEFRLESFILYFGQLTPELQQDLIGFVVGKQAGLTVAHIFEKLNSYIEDGRTGDFMSLFELCSPQIQQQVLGNFAPDKPNNLLMNALYNGNRAIYVYLLPKVVDPLALIFDTQASLLFDGDGEPKAKDAALDFCRETITNLITHPDANKAVIDEKRLLNIAAFFGATAAVQAALEKGADPTVTGSKGQTALGVTAFHLESRRAAFLEIQDACFTSMEKLGGDKTRYSKAIVDSNALLYLYRFGKPEDLEAFRARARTNRIKLRIKPSEFFRPFIMLVEGNALVNLSEALQKFDNLVRSGVIDLAAIPENDGLAQANYASFKLRCLSLPGVRDAFDSALMHGVERELEKQPVVDFAKVKRLYEELLSIRGEEGKLKLQDEILLLAANKAIDEVVFRTGVFGESITRANNAKRLTEMFVPDQSGDIDLSAISNESLRLRASPGVDHAWLNQFLSYKASFIPGLNQADWDPAALEKFFLNQESAAEALKKHKAAPVPVTPSAVTSLKRPVAPPPPVVHPVPSARLAHPSHPTPLAAALRPSPPPRVVVPSMSPMLPGAPPAPPLPYPPAVVPPVIAPAPVSPSLYPPAPVPPSPQPAAQPVDAGELASKDELVKESSIDRAFKSGLKLTGIGVGLGVAWLVCAFVPGAQFLLPFLFAAGALTLGIGVTTTVLSGLAKAVDVLVAKPVKWAANKVKEPAKPPVQSLPSRTHTPPAVATHKGHAASVYKTPSGPPYRS